ncbi:MAG: fibronectin type III domain-containing protein [bacterium]
MAILLLAIVTLNYKVLSTRAADATGLQDLVSNESIGGLATHRISFVLSAANTFSFGEELVIDFPAEFSMGGIWSVADFTFTDDLARTVKAVDSGPGVVNAACLDGANNVGVAVDTTTNTFRVIPCGASFTPSAVAASTSLVILGAGPNGTLTNPNLEGSYTITITDAAGDCSGGCDMVVPIVDRDWVSIAAVVVPVCGNSMLEEGEQCDDGNIISGDGCSNVCVIEGGGPPQPGDVTPPVITFQCASTAATNNSITATWQTDEPADSTLQCGLTTAYGLTSYNASLIMAHSLTIDSLAEGTYYHCRVCSKDSPGNSACSPDCTVLTLDETPPVISNAACTDVTSNSFRVTWDTNENATSFVDYGLVIGPPYANIAGQGDSVLSHSVTVSGLVPSTSYHYRIRTGDVSGNEALSADLTCTTSGVVVAAPVISNVRVTDISCVAPISAVVRWDTDKASDSKVDYGPVVGPPYASLVSDPADVLVHVVTLNNLLGNLTYHYRVRSEDAGGLESASGDAVFTTPSGASPIISNVRTSGLGVGSATIQWDTDTSSNSTVDYGPTVAYGSSQSDAASVVAHSVLLPGLNACSTYHYRVRSSDSCTPESVSVDGSFVTAFPPAPAIQNLMVSNIGENSARVSWSTTTPTSSFVDYGPTVAYGSLGSTPGLALEHLVVLNDLLPGVTYHFRVRSADSCSQSVSSADGTFTTLSDIIPPGCVMNTVAVPGNSRINLTWTNPPDADLQGVRVVRRQGVCPAGHLDGIGVYDGLAGRFEDLGVVNGLSYCYGAFGYDEVGNYGCGGIASATPVGPADVTPPNCPANLSIAVGNGRLTLTWTNPADPDFAGTRIVRRTDRMPVGPADGLVIFEGAGTEWVDAGLVNGTTYYYGVFSYDLTGNYCAGVFAQGVPAVGADVVAPLCAAAISAVAGDQQILVTWSNPADPDWVGTRIVRRDDRAPAGPADGLAVFEGVSDNHLDLGLTNGRTYFYGAYTYDAARNYCIGPTASATPDAELPPPVLDCTDSDGGLDYFVRGTVTVREGDFLDACVNRSVLRENYCSEGGLATTDYQCGSGYKCAAGRCIPATPVQPTSFCGNGICERQDCNIDCGQMSYDLYIVNPDGSERHMDTALVRSENLAENRIRLSYEDDGLDMDFNDVVMILDTNSCSSVGVTLVSRSSPLNHQVRLLVRYRGVPKLDRLVWQDSMVSMGSSTNLNVSDDPSICEGNENELSCPVDCPAEPLEPEVEEDETVPEDERLFAESLNFFATSARIPLPQVNSTVDVFPELSVIVSLPSSVLLQEPQTVHLNLAGSSYIMTANGGAFEAKVVTPAQLGRHPFSVVVNYGDGLVNTVQAFFNVIPFGRVVEQKDDAMVPVPGARVSLFSELGGGRYDLWPSAASGQLNPTVSSNAGTYAFVAPVGSYRLRVEKEGYRSKETLVFPVTNALVSRELVLIAEPKKTDDTLQNIIEQVDFQTKATVEEVKEFADNPFVEQGTEDRVVPAAVAVATANVAVASAATATAAPYLLYLYSLLTHPSLLFGARRRKKWGVVYDAITKQPVDLAIVRLLNDQTGRTVRSMVTDREGRYFFIVNDGSYRMTVAKSGYVFPSVYLKNVREDIRFVNLYHGETINVASNTTITANIPIDPIAKEKAPRRVFWEGIARRLQKGVSLLTLVAMVAAVIISPTPFVIGMLAANIVLFLLFRRLASGRRPKNWGIVYDQQTKKPIRNAIVRIFEARYNKLLETRVTDLRGRYAFLVGNNVYYVTYEKPGYHKKQVGPMDLMAVKKREEQLIASDVGLVPDHPVGFWSGLRSRLAASLGISDGSEKKAKLSRPPLAEKIGQTGHLIVRPGEDPNSLISDEPKQVYVVSETSTVEAKPSQTKVPWELSLLTKASGKAVDNSSKEVDLGTTSDSGEFEDAKDNLPNSS